MKKLNVIARCVFEVSDKSNSNQPFQENDEQCNVHLTSKEILDCRKKLNGLVIAPFYESKAKGVGYNLSLSEMVYSISRNTLVPICHDPLETYFYLRPCETVLALSYESVETNKCTAGSFHSRVRITAQGIGSISTTLDPEWQGMLLFSLNNPTRKKIKVIISTRVDGVIKPNPIITLIAWKTSDKESSKDSLLLRLDNPPMRSDIWSELTTKSVKFFRNRQYKQFCRLVESLSSFEFVPSSNIKWVNILSDLIIQLKIAIDATNSETDARAVLVRIKSFNNDTLPNIYNANVLPKVLSEDLEQLTCVLDDKDGIMAELQSDSYKNIINLTEREIQYQLLCDQVYQIHNEIKKQVPNSWRRSKMAHIRKIITDNMVLILSTILSVILVIVFWYYDLDSLINIISAIVPFILSVVYELVNKRQE